MANFALPYTGEQTSEYLAKARDFAGVPLGNGVYANALQYTAYNQYLNDNGALFTLSTTVATPYTTNTALYPNASSDPNLKPYTDFQLDILVTIARSLNVNGSQVIFSTDIITPLDNILYIYDDSSETIYAKPPTVTTIGEKILSVTGDQLTTTIAVYAMVKVSHGGNGINQIQNSNFIVNGPTIVLSAVAQSFVANDEVKAGFFCEGAVTGLTYIDGKLNATSGKIYTDVPNTGALASLSVFTASIANTNLAANVNNVSWSLINGDTVYRVVIDFGAGASDVFSVQFETGDKATGHSVSTNQELGAPINGFKVFGEIFGGNILDGSTLVEEGKIYLMVDITHPRYGSFLYFDAPETPVSPIAYSASYGGTVKDGFFGETEKTGGDNKCFYGYRAGINATFTLRDVYIGGQAGEGSNSFSVSFYSGGNAGVGYLALHDSVAASTVAVGTETANHLVGDKGVYAGSFAGNSAVGDDGTCVGFRSAEKSEGDRVTFLGGESGFEQKGFDVVGVGYKVLLGNLGFQNLGLGNYVLGNATGNRNCAGGQRGLERATGDSNATWGYQSGYNVGLHSYSNCTYSGFESGSESNASGATGTGRDALKGNLGDFASAFGYLAGVNNLYARVTLLGQGTSATGVDQVQLGAVGTTTYAYGPVQDRSDIRDKTDFNLISNGLKSFFHDVEFKTYRMDYRESYNDYEQVQTGIDDEDKPIFETKIFKVDKDGSRSGDRHHAGAIAQQVKEAMDKHGVDFAGYQDHAINGGDDVKSIGYQEFIAIIGSIVQDHEKELLTLSERLAALEGK